MDNEKQQIFNFGGDKRQGKAGNRDEAGSTSRLKPLQMKRAVLGWLALEKPSALAVKVPTRISRYQADVAAFWSKPSGRRSGKVLQPAKTVIVEIRYGREDCWPDCSRQEELLPRLRKMKEEKKSREAGIRHAEPELRDSDNLFNEYETWRYMETKDPGYHQCVKKIEELEHALYNGSRFEQIRRAHVAEYLYLAVPENTVHPDELADGWGLLEVNTDFSVRKFREAEKWDCPMEKKLHLVQNIASATAPSLLFSYGIRVTPGDELVFTPVPRRRRGPQE